MKTYFNKRLSVINLWILILSASMTIGMCPVIPVENLGQINNRHSVITGQDSILLVENEAFASTAGEKNQYDSDKEEAGPIDDGSGPSAQTKTTPLKPFEPSEEIAAEQEVDFPADI